jgi:hypothetical protein
MKTQNKRTQYLGFGDSTPFFSISLHEARINRACFSDRDVISLGNRFGMLKRPRTIDVMDSIGLSSGPIFFGNIESLDGTSNIDIERPLSNVNSGANSATCTISKVISLIRISSINIFGSGQFVVKVSL